MEYIRKCDICGKIWCYSDGDLKENSRNSKIALLNSIGGVAAAVGGTVMHNSYFADERERSASKIVDYTKCPHCHSKKTHIMSDTEFEDYQVLEARKKIDVHTTATVDTIVLRAENHLKQGEWVEARAYAEIALDMDVNNVTASLLIVMAKLKIRNKNELADSNVYLQDIPQWSVVVRNADSDLLSELRRYEAAVTQRLHSIRYDTARQKKVTAKTEAEFKTAAELFEKLGDFENSVMFAQECREKAEETRKNAIYNNGFQLMGAATREKYMLALAEFKKIPGWRNADDKAAYCQSRITELAKKENEAVLKSKEFADSNKALYKKALIIELCLGIVTAALTSVANKAVSGLFVGIMMHIVLLFPTLLSTLFATKASKKAASNFMRISGILGTILYVVVAIGTFINNTAIECLVYVSIAITNLIAAIFSFMRK